MQGKDKLLRFLNEVLPNHIPPSLNANPDLNHIKTRDDFLKNVDEGIQVAPMAVRLTPYILSIADWANPLQDPIRRQFIPLRSGLVKDHPSLGLDSLHEAHHSPVEGLVHRYPDKVLFLGKLSIVPRYDHPLMHTQRRRYAQYIAAFVHDHTPLESPRHRSIR